MDAEPIRQTTVLALSGKTGRLEYDDSADLKVAGAVVGENKVGGSCGGRWVVVGPVEEAAVKNYAPGAVSGLFDPALVGEVFQ